MSAEEFFKNPENYLWDDKKLYYDHDADIEPMLLKYCANQIYFVDGKNRLVKMTHELEITNIQSIKSGFTPNTIENEENIYVMTNKTTSILLLIENDEKIINFPDVIYAVCIIKDKATNRFVLLAGAKAKIFLYDICSSRIITVFKTNNGIICGFIGLSGCNFLSISQDKTVHTWDLRKSDYLQSFSGIKPHLQSAINSFHVDESGTFLLQINKQFKMIVTNIHTGNIILQHPIKIKNQLPKDVKFYGKSFKYALILTECYNIHLVNLETGQFQLLTAIYSKDPIMRYTIKIANLANK
uniref:WD_REPEATS_REGION domain-containing protein n=1 Tax=Rhabditophanes sp. KR3021 TaxID=114890 RepID=A0AC35UIL3_9BILA